VSTVLDLQARYAPLALTVLHHGQDSRQIQMRRLLPPLGIFSQAAPARGSPPRVNLPDWQLFSELVDHYLFAGLNGIFYSSLLVENQRRAQHLEAAARRLDEQVSRLTLRINALRQEEITEEIEVILLSAPTGASDP
jgi:F-type H+-transporting ATPase subunit gamma